LSTFKDYFTYDCISFTFLMLIYTFLVHVGLFPQPEVIPVFQFFAMTSCAEVLMFLTDHFTGKNRMLKIFVDLLDVLASVFVLGAALRMFSLVWQNILEITAMVLVIYFGVYGVAVIKNTADASLINHKIREIRNRGNGGGGK
jgi:hypothetical protein